MHEGRRTETAFTMIELIVAMVLLAIAIAIVGTALVHALSGSGASTSGAISDSAIARVTARFQDDLAVAQTDDRARGLVREQVVLDEALRTDRDAPSDDPLTPKASVDLEDIVTASANRIQFKADVDRTTPGAECVTWAVTQSGTEYSIVRTVGNAGCGGGTSETLVTGRTDSSTALLQPFSYDLRCNRNLCTGSGASPATPCATWNVPSVAGRRDLRRIVAVRATFVSNAGKDATEGRSSTAMSIRSRQDHMWTTALGC